MEGLRLITSQAQPLPSESLGERLRSCIHMLISLELPQGKAGKPDLVTDQSKDPWPGCCQPFQLHKGPSGTQGISTAGCGRDYTRDSSNMLVALAGPERV